MKWAHEQELIQHNPCAGVRRTVGATKERGILSESEISALVSHTWSDERARMAFLLALTTGLRLGEVIALQVRDIGTDRLYIRHSWNDDDRLKAPKNGKTREAVILPQVREGLLSLVHSNPYGSSQSTFLFYGGQQDRPLDGQALSRMFDDALVQIEMGDAFNSAQLEIRKSVLKSIRSRGLSFHSLRHGFAKAMADRLKTEQAMKATGHLTGAMLEHYADHRQEQDFQAIKDAASEAFGKVLNFRKGA
jgi:integrase